MNALILVNAYAPTPYTRQVTRLRDELTARGVNVTVSRNDGFIFSVGSGGAVGSTDCDFCVYLDKDKYVAELLEARGVKLFNSAKSIEICDDKMLTHIALAGKVKMPDTLPGLLCYDKTVPVSDATLDRIESALGYPVVVKRSYGSQGYGVFKADTRDELRALAESVKLEPHLFQKFIASSASRDMRVIVINGKTVGGIIRRSNADFRSNVGLGGKAEKAQVPENIKRAAETAAREIGLDYCGIDFLLDDEPLLCEVNSNAFFDAFEAATSINVAGLYAEHMINRMK